MCGTQVQYHGHSLESVLASKSRVLLVVHPQRAVISTPALQLLVPRGARFTCAEAGFSGAGALVCRDGVLSVSWGGCGADCAAEDFALGATSVAAPGLAHEAAMESAQTPPHIAESGRTGVSETFEKSFELFVPWVSLNQNILRTKGSLRAKTF